jgi:hypothetical protein
MYGHCSLCCVCCVDSSPCSKMHVSSICFSWSNNEPTFSHCQTLSVSFGQIVSNDPGHTISSLVCDSDERAGNSLDRWKAGCVDADLSVAPVRSGAQHRRSRGARMSWRRRRRTSRPRRRPRRAHPRSQPRSRPSSRPPSCPHPGPPPLLVSCLLLGYCWSGLLGLLV